MIWEIQNEVTRTRHWLLVVVFVAIIAAMVAGAWRVAKMIVDPARPISVSVPAAPAKEIKFDAPAPTAIATKTVKAYKPAVKRSLNLPKAVQDNPDALVVAASNVAADDHPHTVTTVINANTGEVQTFDRRDPLPWLAFNTHGRAGIYYGVKAGVQTVRLEAQQELLQVKAAHIGLIGSVDQPIGAVSGTDYYAGVGVWVAW